MISLVCTKCSATMNVDDGFAGGVCRCSKCGTIQTVPARGQTAAAGEAIFERRARNTNGDLEALGDVVSSSGLAGSGMLREAQRPATMPDPTRRRRTTLAILLGAAVAVIVAALLVLALGRGESRNDPAASVSNSSSTIITTGSAATPKSGEPSFGPIALNVDGPVVYLVDRGDATRAYTASLQSAIVKSVASLGPSRKFQVRYWTADDETPVFPQTPAEATPVNLSRLASWIKDVGGGRSTDARASLDSALAVKPAEIVILTGKAWQLDDAFANEMTLKLSTAKVRIHAVALGGSTGSDALSRIAARTGGTFVEMDEPTLAAIGAK